MADNANREKLSWPPFRDGLILFLATCLWLTPALAWGASFSAGLDRNTISFGDSARLSLTFSGGEPQAIPSLPTIPGLQIVYSGRSSQINIANGQVSSTVTHTYNVIPQQPGDFTIPALAVDIEGQKLTSQALQLKVLKPGTTSPDADGTGSLAFLRLLSPKKTVYEGEVFAVELQLLVRQGIRGVSQFQLSALPAEGFTMGKIVDGGQRTVQVGSLNHTAVSWLVPLRAARHGSWTIGPVSASVVVEVPGRRNRSPFEQFGIRSPFDILGGEERRVGLVTEPVEVTVQPLPPNAPTGFSGAVGEFQMEVSVGPTNVAVGDPITVRIQLTGRGALDTVNLPEQPGWRDFKTYPPTAKVETTDALGFQGTKTFEQVIVAEKPDLRKLPPLRFSFFDPEQGEYRTLTHPEVSLVVRPAPTAASPTVAAPAGDSQEESPIQRDIVHIKPKLGVLTPSQAPLLRQGWFLALQAVPLLAFIASLLRRKHLERLASNPRLRRRRQVAELTREGFAELRRLASEKDSDAFFALVFRLLQEQIGERLDLPSTAITEAIIEDQLRPRGVPDDVLASLQELFQLCNLARYAPVQSTQELNSIVPRVESVVKQWQEVRL